MNSAAAVMSYQFQPPVTAAGNKFSTFMANTTSLYEEFSAHKN